MSSEPRRAYSDGAWRRFESVRLALDDRAVLYGDTVFETVRVEASVPLLWREHRRRFVRSLSLAAFPERKRIVAEVDRAVRSLPAIAHGVLRVTVSRGVGSGLRRQTVPHVYAALTPTTPQAQPGKVRLALVDAPRSAHGLYAAKHGNYAFAAACVQRARGFGDVLFCDRRDRVYETSTGNIFIVQKRTLLTPPADGTILEGTTRNVILRGAERLGLAVKERAFDVKALLFCDEAFVTSAIVGLTQVSHVGRTRIVGDGALTRALFGVYRARVAREIGR